VVTESSDASGNFEEVFTEPLCQLPGSTAAAYFGTSDDPTSGGPACASSR